MSKYWRCPECDKVVSFYIPSKGDGSGWRARRHKIGTEVCIGSYGLYDAQPELDHRTFMEKWSEVISGCASRGDEPQP